MKRALIFGIPSVLILAVVGLLMAPGFVDWSQYKSTAQAQIKNLTGYDASLNGRISVALLPAPRLFVEDVSVKAPEGSAQDYIVKIKRLNAHLAFAPLLSGKIEVASISLVEPSIALEIFKDGRKNWMTPEIEAMTGGAAQSQSGQSIALKNISIENGSFIYADGAAGAAPVAIESINAEAEAESLRGPFTASGDFKYTDKNISFKIGSGAMDDSNSVALNVSAAIEPMGASFEYAGVVSTAAPFSAQGETTLAVQSLKSITGTDTGAVKIKGLMTATAEKIGVKNAVIALDSNKFSGDIAAEIKPLKISAKLKSEDTINIDEFLKGSKGAGAGGEFPPKTLSMPMAFDAHVTMSAPGIVWNNQVYNGINVEFIKQPRVFAGRFAADGAPGKAAIDTKIALTYAAKSAGKDGTEIYSDPSVAVSVKAKTQNLQQTVESISGRGDVAYLGAWKNAEINADIVMAGNVTTLKPTVLTLDGDTFNISGSYAALARPKITADISAANIDIDAVQNKFGGGKAPAGNAAETIRNFALPFDLDFDVGAQEAKFQGRTIKGLRAQGTVRDNAINFSNVSAQDYAGAAIKIAGGIGNVKNLSGIDMKVEAESGDIKSFAKTMGVDAAGLPDSIKSATVSVIGKGAMDRLNVDAAIKAIGGSFSAKGDVSDPLGTMQISGLAVGAQHPNLAQAIQAFSPKSQRITSMEKPFDFAANIDRAGNVYTLKDMKANIAGSPVSGNITVDTGAAKPIARGDITLDRLVVQTGAAASGGDGNGRWSSAPMDSAWMNVYEADFSVKANQILYQNWDLQKPNLNVSLRGGSLRISDMSAGLFGGKMAMNAALKGAASGKGYDSVTGDANFTGVEAEGLVKALTGASIINATGEVNAKMNIATAGASQVAMINALSGDGVVNGKNIVLEGFDLARFAAALSDENRPAETLSGLWKGVSKGGSTQFDTLDGAFKISGGVANINKMDLDGPRAKLGTTGTVDLPRWRLETAHVIALKPKAGQAPADVAPPFTIKIAGPLDNPAQTFGQGAINDYLQRKLNRKLQGVIQKKLGGEAGGLVGNLLGLPPQQQAPAPEAAPEAAPAAGDEWAAPDQNAPVNNAPPPEPAPKQSKNDLRDEAIKGVLQGILGQ
jgi:uncharacterized protein involved in outer membrane biogenesis